MRLNVLYIDHLPKFGGSTRALLNILDMFDKGVVNPLVICPEGSAIIPYFEEAGIKLETTKMSWFTKKASVPTLCSYIFRLAATALFIIERVKKYQISIIHANGIIPLLYSIIPAFITRVPLIWHMHDILDIGLVNRIFVRLGGRSADKIICVSKVVQKRLIEFGVKEEKCQVIYNFISTKKSDGEARSSFRKEIRIPESSWLVGMIGNITFMKGQKVFIEAAKGILARFPHTVFVIIGDTQVEEDKAYKEALLDMIREKGIVQNVILTGFRKDVLSIISEMDIVIHPPVLPEAFGYVLLEAMHEEKPVIASDIGGIPEIVIDGVNGFLFEPKDAMFLAERVCRLLAEPDLMTRMGKNGKSILFDTFSPEQSIAKIKAIYQELIG